jgi:hypothetical protein
MPDGGFALTLGDDVERGGGERSEDACLSPVQALASLWASAGVVAGAVCPAADREVPGAEVALSVEACAIRSGVPAEGADDRLVPVIAEAGGPTAVVARLVLPQPEDGFAAAGSVGSEGIGADEIARGEGLALASADFIISEPDGEDGKRTPAAPEEMVLVAGDKRTVTTASRPELAQGEFAVPSPIPMSFPPHTPIEAVDCGSVAPGLLTPLLVAPGAPSGETGLNAVLPVLLDTGETVSGPVIPDAAQTAAPQEAELETLGLASAPALSSTAAIPTADDAPIRMSAPISASQRSAQRPTEGGREQIPVHTPAEDTQPQPQRSSFWERFFTGPHPDSVAESVTKEPDPPALASMGFTPDAQRGSVGEMPVLQSEAGLVLDPARRSTGQAAQASPAGSITAARAPEVMPVRTDPVLRFSLERKPDTDLVLAALPPGLLATPGQTSTGAPQAPTFPVPQVAAQIVADLSRSPEGTTELALAPEELGHVRLKLKPDAANPDRMVVMVTFERPETLDLFRRHAGELTEALRAAGYAGVDIGFGQEGGAASGSDRPQQGIDSGYEPITAADSADPIRTAPRLMAGASLDLRL